MTVTANNPALYNAAYSAALAGQLAGNGLTGIPAVDDSTGPSVYAKASNVASAFAFQFDQVAFTTAVTNLSSSHATVPPTTAAEAATTSAVVSALWGLVFGMFFQRKGGDVESDSGTTPADWAAQAAAVAAQLTVVQALYAASGTLV
jgi:hypothetical protein